LAIFSGLGEDSERFIYYELVVGTWGALPTADGNDGLCNPCATAANIPVEVAEADFPIMIEKYGFIPDSGGAGRFRGGLAVERVWRTLADATTMQVRSDRQNHPPYGLYGGGSGKRSENLLAEGGSSTFVSLPPMFSTVVGAQSVFDHRMPGGGGWGDPLERDPEQVARDVHNEKVSVLAAREHYGVVMQESALDVAGTTELRRAMRSADDAESGSS
jgi:N-methylhydantoinase B